MQADLRSATVPSGRLPSGRHSLARDIVLASQRGRLLEAMAEAVAEHGYGTTTVADVVARAGVSRKTFYEHFSDKEDCFLATYDTGVAFVLAQVAAAALVTGDWRDRARTGLRTFLETLAAEPAFTRAIILEVHAAGAAARRRHRDVLAVFAERYREINAQARAEDAAVAPLPEPIPLAIVGAIIEVVAARVSDGGLDGLPDLAEPLGAFVIRNVAPAAAPA
jgi:AcrR family transcriptional regulator